MKAVAYSVKPFEKEYIARANQRKHDITLISNALSIETAAFAAGKEVALVFTNDEVSAPVIDRLADFGIKYIATRSTGTDHIDKAAAARRNIKLANVPEYAPQSIAEHAVALVLALSRKLVHADAGIRRFDFRIDDLIGFNLYQKTVGIIGLGHIGRAAAAIFNGFGCRVLGYDVRMPADLGYIQPVSLETLLQESDIISLHAPLTPQTKYLINRATISQMKKGVMLINTSRGALIDTSDTLSALDSGRIGYLGLDVYEFERHLFFGDHENDQNKDLVLNRLLAHPNVLITPHQAFLTVEALQQIANQTIANLDAWQLNKCTEQACACNEPCSKKNKDVKIDPNPIILLP